MIVALESNWPFPISEASEDVLGHTSKTSAEAANETSIEGGLVVVGPYKKRAKALRCTMVTNVKTCGTSFPRGCKDNKAYKYW